MSIIDHVFQFLMRVLHKILLNLIIAVSFLVLFYAFQTSDSGEHRFLTSVENLTSTLQAVDRRDGIKTTQGGSQGRTTSLDIPVTPVEVNKKIEKLYNIWCIFTKVSSNAPMKHKFKTFTNSLLQHSSIHIALHIITDNSSRSIAEDVVDSVKESTIKYLFVRFYDVNVLAEKLEDIISSMQPHFSSQPGTYYSDALFFLSLGLHRIAEGQDRAIMFDADTKLLTDVAQLFQEFDKFGPATLFGLSHELTPVYRHVLYMYRAKHKTTLFGEPTSRGGFPGVNSGVILLRFDRMRLSQEYNKLLEPEAVNKLTEKYSFKGHLGDQDFYTLLSMEHPEMVHQLQCGWNRQLCTWWREHGYRDVFDEFFRCDEPVKVYHGNCNTPIPND